MNRNRRTRHSERLSIDRLEDRLTPTASPIDPSSLFIDPAARAQLGIVETSWNGSPTYVFQNQWIAGFSGWTGNRIEQMNRLRSLLAPEESRVRLLDQLGASGTFLLETSPALTNVSLREILSPIGSLRYIEPNFALSATAVPTDPSFASQWALNNTGASGGVVDADIDAPEAWDLAQGTSGIVVGVIDSGVMYTHPDLAANMWVNPGEVAGDGLDNDGNGYVDDVYGYDFANNDSDPMDDDGHGTAVAGIIAAATNNGAGVAGINWGGKIMALKYARSGFVASTADVTEAVNYATMMRRDYGVNVRATNNSYGIFGYSQTLADAIEAGGEAGILFVSSAGNSNTDNDVGPQYPANYPLESVLSVAATTRQDLKASFSSFGATTVQLGAPGLDVLTTRLGGGYSGFSGTSAASPVVAGVAALLWDYAPYSTLTEIRQALLDGTDPIPALQGITVTGGRVNAYNSMLELGFVVRQFTPNANAIVTSPPTSFTVRLSQPFDPTSLNASDLTVNGVSADSVTITDSQTLTFSYLSSPVTTEGPQTISLASSSLKRQADGRVLRSATSIFRYDAVPLTVTSSLPTSSSVAGVPLSSISVTWNEAIDPASVSTKDLIITQGKVVGAQATGANTVLFTLEGVEREGSFTYSIPAGAIKDLAGNPSTAFSASLDLDVTERSLVKSFERIGPLGSLVFLSEQNQGRINSAGDEDVFTFSLLEGETILAVVRPTSPTATINADWANGQASSSSATPGAAVQVPLLRANTSGVYRLRISADQVTTYTFDLYRNTMLEGTDSTSAAPLSLAPSRLDVGAGRYAVVGRSELSSLLWTMDTNPGWTLGSQWSWGQPAGLGGDPNRGFTGNNVLGNNLNGVYANRLTTTNYATLGPVNLVGKTGVTLSFQRWLGIETSTLDRVNIQVSNNGSTWTTIYQNSGPTFQETAWSLQTYNIGSVADNQPNVYVRFGIGPTSTSGAFSGWNIDDVVIRGNEDGPAKSVEEDAYTLDLTSSVGHSIDIALAGLKGKDFSNSQLDLVGPDGVTILRSAVTTTSGVDATSADLVIENFVVPTPGVYKLVFRTQTTGEYSLVVTDNIVLETEPDNVVTGPARSLDSTGQAIGYVGIPQLSGSNAFTIDSSQSSIQLQARVFLSNGALDLPIVEQAPGSLDAALTGTFTASRGADGSLTFQSANLDLTPNPGSFLPGSSSADFAGQVNLLGLIAQAAIRDVRMTLSSDSLAVDSNGYFDATRLHYEFTAGNISYSALGMSQTFPVNTPDTGNDVTSQGRIEFLPGFARITLPLALKFIANVPLGFNLEMNFTATIVGTVPMPVNDIDTYSISLAAGDALTFCAVGWSLPARPESEFLLPAVEAYDPAGLPIAITSSVNPSDRTAMGRFVAPTAGVYKIVVRAQQGFGEYGLMTERVTPPVVDIAGPSTAVRGEPLAFTLVASDNRTPDPLENWKFEIDWDGNGTWDEIIVAPSGTSVTHVFPETGSFGVRARATRFDEVTSQADTQNISILAMQARASVTNPGKTDFIVGGTTGGDVYMFIGRLMVVLMEGTQVYGTILPDGRLIGGVDLRPIPAFDGNFIVYAQGGADVIAAELVANPSFLYGGDGDDVLLGGINNDLIDGGAGNDFLQGGAFGTADQDTLIGGEGNDILIGGRGADVLRGGLGSDVLIAGSLNLPGYPLTGRYALQAEWRTEQSYTDRVNHLLGNGPTTGINEPYRLVPGTTVLDDDAVDELFGDEGEDLFFADSAQDLVADRILGEQLLDI